MSQDLDLVLHLFSIGRWIVPEAHTRSTSTCDFRGWSPGERLTMTKTRTIGTLAAIGGVTATIALLTGLPAANADELADLRANQELLQRRIDQLAQGQPPAPGGIPGGGPGSPFGPHPTPGGPAGGGSFPRSFLIPGTDTSIRVGGFVDYTALYYLEGNNTSNPGTS